MSDRYSLDWSEMVNLLDEKTNERQDKLLFAEHKNRFTKIAFDLFRENNTNSIWKIETTEDGIEHIVRTTMKDPSGINTQAKRQGWTVVADSKTENVILAYKETPIQSFSKKIYNFDNTTVDVFKQLLLEKSANKAFVKTLIKILPSIKREALKKDFPELFTE